jgi:hypothetical protein
LSPVESVDDVVLITHVSRVLPYEAAELNASEEKRENKNNRENAKADFTGPGRKCYTAPKRLRDHFPLKRKAEIDSTILNSLCSKLPLV